MNWTYAEAALESGVASVFDVQQFRMLPRKAAASVNQPAVADASRAEFDFCGTLELGPPFLPAGRGASGDPSARDRTVGYEAVLTAHDAAWPWRPVRGDLVRDAASVDWKIVNIDRDGSHRPALHLNRA